MLSYILQVSACWGIFFLLYALLLSRNTFFSWNRAYLMLTLIISLALPTLEWPAPEAPSAVACKRLTTCSLSPLGYSNWRWW